MTVFQLIFMISAQAFFLYLKGFSNSTVKNQVWSAATISERPSSDPQRAWRLPDTHLGTFHILVRGGAPRR